MKKYKYICICLLLCLCITGCKSKNTGCVWDGNQAKGSYRNHTSYWDNEEVDTVFNATEEDFVALDDDDLKITKCFDGALAQPKTEPGEKESGLPGIDGFKAPSGELAAIFKPLHFKLDDYILRDKEELALVDRISEYLKKHPDCYLFVEGHCDERGPEAYNLSLGSRRANYIRTLLVQKGVDAEHVHTVSYGKERPLDLGHNQEAWAKNRRGQFRVFYKK